MRVALFSLHLLHLPFYGQMPGREDYTVIVTEPLRFPTTSNFVLKEGHSIETKR
jgi:hypothetical protein